MHIIRRHEEGDHARAWMKHFTMHIILWHEEGDHAWAWMKHMSSCKTLSCEWTREWNTSSCRYTLEHEYFHTARMIMLNNQACVGMHLPVKLMYAWWEPRCKVTLQEVSEVEAVWYPFYAVRCTLVRFCPYTFEHCLFLLLIQVLWNPVKKAIRRDGRLSCVPLKDLRQKYLLITLETNACLQELSLCRLQFFMHVLRCVDSNRRIWSTSTTKCKTDKRFRIFNCIWPSLITSLKLGSR